MAAYYSFVYYCVQMICFIGGVIFLNRAIGGVLFEVQGTINSNQKLELVPKRAGCIYKWLAGLMGAGLIYLLGGLFMPVFLCTPKILAGKPIGIPNEILSGHRGEIAFSWILVAVILIGLTGKRLLTSLTKRVKQKEKKVEIYLWGMEYSVFLLLQAFATSVCLLCLVGSLAGGYSRAVEQIWNISMWADFVLVIINGIFPHQKLFIFNSEFFTYQKYFKSGYGKKEDLEFVTDDSNKVIVKIKGEEICHFEKNKV